MSSCIMVYGDKMIKPFFALLTIIFISACSHQQAFKKELPKKFNLSPTSLLFIMDDHGCPYGYQYSHFELYQDEQKLGEKFVFVNE